MMLGIPFRTIALASLAPAGLLLAALGAPVLARTVVEIDRGGEAQSISGGGDTRLPDYLQCVPYARRVTGIQLRGDAWTWWEQAQGRYPRGSRPRVGAIMAFQPHGKMELGHVAAVSKIIDSRTVLLRHANWSPINGRRGQIEDNVRAVDVSPDNDWSEVRVWFAPIQNLGTTHWPVHGFIYPAKAAFADKDAPRGAPGREAKAGPAAVLDPIGAIIAERLARKR